MTMHGIVSNADDVLPEDRDSKRERREIRSTILADESKPNYPEWRCEACLSSVPTLARDIDGSKFREREADFLLKFAELCE